MFVCLLNSQEKSILIIIIYAFSATKRIPSVVLSGTVNAHEFIINQYVHTKQPTNPDSSKT